MRFSVLHVGYIFLLRALIGLLYCLCPLWLAGVKFTTVSWKLLYLPSVVIYFYGVPRWVCRTRVRLKGTLQRQRERYKTKDWLVCFLCTFLNRPRKNNDVKVMRFWRTRTTESNFSSSFLNWRLALQIKFEQVLKAIGASVKYNNSFFFLGVVFGVTVVIA